MLLFQESRLFNNVLFICHKALSNGMEQNIINSTLTMNMMSHGVIQ